MKLILSTVLASTIISTGIQLVLAEYSYASSTIQRSVSKAIIRKYGTGVKYRFVKKPRQQNDYEEILRRDALRDAKSKAIPLEKQHNVYRYTSKEQAIYEKNHGIAAGSHMTSGVIKGRPINAETAQKRYGLRKKPEVRMEVRVPEGQPIRKNKVISGAPGYGEWTSTRKIAKNQITAIKTFND